MPRNTAMSVRAAVSQILKIEAGWEGIDVRRLDADSLIARFRNLSKLSPGSLATYESRFRSGLSSYLSYLDNPTSYQPKARKQSLPREPGPQKSPSGRRRTGGGGPVGAAERSPSLPTPVQAGVRLVVYPFPVRPDVFAELKLPADLTAEEAERLCGFLRSVALAPLT